MYLERFTLPDAEQEEELIMERICETRDCAGFVDNPYPCRLFPARGLRELYFQKTTILYGGNGSGKSTLLNLIAEKLKLNRIAPFNSGEMVKAYSILCEFVSNGQMSKELALNGEIYGAITGIQWNHYGGTVSLL